MTKHDGLLKASIAVGVLVSVFSIGSIAGEAFQLAHADSTVASQAARMRGQAMPRAAVQIFEETQREQFAVMRRWMPAQAATHLPYALGGAAFAVLAYLSLKSARGYSRLARAAAAVAVLRVAAGVVEWRLGAELAPLVRRIFTTTVQQNLAGPASSLGSALARGMGGMMQSEMMTSSVAWTLALAGYFGYVAVTLWNEPDAGGAR